MTDRWRGLWLDELPAEWQKTVDSASSFAGLLDAIETDWRPLVEDARQEVLVSAEDEWPVFAGGLAEERAKRFAGESWAKRWGAVLIPDVLMVLGTLPSSMSMPVRVACRRLVEVDILAEQDGVYVVAERPGGDR